MHLRVSCLVLLLGLGGPLRASPPQAGDRPERAPAERSFEKVHERLRARPAEERARLERHLEEFEQLPPQARAKILERAHALREHERSVGTVPGELGALDGERAREAWVAHLRERFRERGRELRQRLPEKLRQRLEQAPPEVRRHFLERLFQEREAVSRRALERTPERFGLSGREIQRMERLPLEERLRAMLALHGTERGPLPH